MGILQAGILEWVAMPSPGDLPNPGIEPDLSHCRWIHTDPVISLALWLESGFSQCKATVGEWREGE